MDTFNSTSNNVFSSFATTQLAPEKKPYSLRWYIALSRSFKVIEIYTNRKHTFDFLLGFQCYQMTIFYRFRDITIYCSKIYGFLPFSPTLYSRLKLSLTV